MDEIDGAGRKLKAREDIVGVGIELDATGEVGTELEATKDID